MLKCSAYINASGQAAKPKANLAFTSWAEGTSKAAYLRAFTKKIPKQTPHSQNNPRHFTSIYLPVRLVAVSVVMKHFSSMSVNQIQDPTCQSLFPAHSYTVIKKHLKYSYQVVNTFLTFSLLHLIQPKSAFNNSWCTGNTANTYIISHLLHFPSSILLQQTLVFPRQKLHWLKDFTVSRLKIQCNHLSCK